MKKVVLGLLVLLSVDVECMKLSMCQEDPEIKEFLIYRLLKVAPDATVNEVVNWVEEGANSLRPSLGATPARVRVTGVGSSCVTCDGMAATSVPVFATAVDAPTDVGGALRSLLEKLRLVEDEKRMVREERDEARVMLSRLQVELNVAVRERDEATATLRTRLREAFDNECRAKRECDDLESELRLLYGTLVGAGYKEEQKGADVVKKSDFDKARADLATVTGERDQARTDLGTALANLTTVTGERDTARADLATAQANLATVTGERDTAQRGLATAQTNLAAVTGERDTARADLATAQANLATVTGERDAFLGVFTGKAHLADIDLRLLRAVFASGLNVSTVDLMDDSKELSKPGNLDDDAKLAALPTAHGLNLSIADLQDHANDVVKVALLRGFFHSATYPDHTQADLDGFSVTCNDGPVALGAGAATVNLGLRLE